MASSERSVSWVLREVLIVFCPCSEWKMRYAFFGHSPDFDFEARIVCLTGLSNSKSHQCEQKANSGFSCLARARQDYPSRFSTPSREQCISLSPRDNLIQFWYFRIGLVHLLQSHTADAIPWLEKARLANPLSPQFHAWLASAYCPQRRHRTRYCRTRRSPQAERRRSVCEHRPMEGRSRRTRGTEDPRFARRHLPCRVAQGRYTGRMTDAASKTQAFDPDGQPRTTSAAEAGIFRLGRQREDCLARGRHGNIHRSDGNLWRLDAFPVRAGATRG